MRARRLVCTISYAKGGEKKSFRKFFKFTVVDSFEWKQRIFHIKVSIPHNQTKTRAIPHDFVQTNPQVDLLMTLRPCGERDTG